MTKNTDEEQASEPKRKRGRPRKSDAAPGAPDEQDSTVTEADDSEQLDDPSLFEDMNQERIPKLESRAKKLAAQRATATMESDKAKGLEEECLIIMADHEIQVYNRHGVHLKIKSKPKLDVVID